MDEAMKYIYEKSLNGNFLSEHDIFNILEYYCMKLDIKNIVKKNFFVGDSDFISKYNEYNKSVMFNVSKMITDATIKSNAIEFTSEFDRVFFINCMIAYHVAYRTSYIAGKAQNEKLYSFCEGLVDFYMEKSMYVEGLKFVNPTYRLSKIAAISLLRDELVAIGNKKIDGILASDMYDTMLFGYYEDEYIFPLNRFCSLADESIPQVDGNLDRMELGAVVPKSEVAKIRRIANNIKK